MLAVKDGAPGLSASVQALAPRCVRYDDGQLFEQVFEVEFYVLQLEVAWGRFPVARLPESMPADDRAVS